MCPKKDNTMSGTSSSLRRVEPVFRNKATIVIKSQPKSKYIDGLSDTYQMKLEKQMLRRFYDSLVTLTLSKNHQKPNTFSSFDEYRWKPVSYSRDFLGVCSVEVQPHGGLIHFHLLIGDLLKVPHPEYPRVFRDFQTNQEYIQHINQHLPSLLKDIYSVDFGRYEREGDTDELSSWIEYLCKDRNNPYITSALRSLIKKTNRIDASTGIIPDELKSHRINFPAERVAQDLEKRLGLLLCEKGGEPYGNDND